MITTIFSKSRPFNYILISILLVLVFLTYQFSQQQPILSVYTIFQIIAVCIILTGSMLLTNFITIKNNLSKNSTYPIYFYLIFLLLFPQIFFEVDLSIAGFLVLLALRKLLALQNLTLVKQKIFDSSLLIFAASLFHFWAILFIILVFVAIVFHVARDYRNWLVPFIALFGTSIMFVLVTTIIHDNNWINFIPKSNLSYDFNYFQDIWQNIAISIYTALSVLFIVFQILSFSTKLSVLHAGFKKIILSFVLGLLIFIISDQKTNAVLVFTFAPMAVMSTNFFENTETPWVKETSVILITILAIMCFVGQL